MKLGKKSYAKGQKPVTKDCTIRFHLYKMFRIGKFIETENRLVCA